MTKRVRVCVAALVLATICGFLTAADSLQSVPDSASFRRQLAETWFAALPDELAAMRPEIFRNDLGQEFQVRYELLDTRLPGNTRPGFCIIVAPRKTVEMQVYDSAGVHRENIDSYPAEVPGAWILFRNMQTGAHECVRQYFSANSEVYVEFTPAGKKTAATFVIYGAVAARNVPVGVEFGALVYLPFSRILELTSSILPWGYAAPNVGVYERNLHMMQVIRENLPRFSPADDSAYNEYGKAVYISTGAARPDTPETLTVSSAGFVKWIVDGLAYPLAGSYLRIEPLRQQTVEFRTGSLSNTISEQYAVSFSLDWTRNLAAAAVSVSSSATYYYHNSGTDVTVQPFSAMITGNSRVSSVGYIKNAGYHTSMLRPLLYELAVTEPDKFYLGAVRQTDRISPEVTYYNNAAAFFPYFDSAGLFDVAVFEDGQELSLGAFIARYPDDYVHLVRINASDRFLPQ